MWAGRWETRDLLYTTVRAKGSFPQQEPADGERRKAQQTASARDSSAKRSVGTIGTHSNCQGGHAKRPAVRRSSAGFLRAQTVSVETWMWLRRRAESLGRLPGWARRRAMTAPSTCIVPNQHCRGFDIEAQTISGVERSLSLASRPAVNMNVARARSEPDAYERIT